MSWTAKYRKQRICALTAAIVATAWMPVAMAGVGAKEMPAEHDFKGLAETGIQREKDAAGNETGRMDIKVDTSGTGIINWKTFNIGKEASVNFTGPDGWRVLNRVDAGNPSEIYGAITGKGGTVFLVNPSGITFHEHASVDVGSFVASTRQMTDDNFNKNTLNFYTPKNDAGQNIDGEIKIMNGAEVKANDGYVALIAQKIYNSGTITAPDVALTTGQKIELKYDDKIYLKVDMSKVENKSAIIETGKNYVLMRGSDYGDIATSSLIENKGIVAATGWNKNEKGEVVLTATNVTLAANSNISSNGGKITTSAYGNIKVDAGANVHSVSSDGQTSGDWNIVGKLVTVGSKNESGKTDNTVNNVALSNALQDTNVHITASPILENDYSDIHVDEKINKTAGKETTLELTAGRNVCVDADITSNSGKLNVILAGDSNKTLGKTNSLRGDGANIIRANIETNGGDFTTERLHGREGESEYLANGTYFSFKEVKDTGESSNRYVKTNGGDINLGGTEVLLGTGGTVEFDTTNENGNGAVYIEGMVNSANYYKGIDEGHDINWTHANEAANNFDKDADGNPTGKSHLAVVTSALEDAIASSSIEQNYNKTKEAYAGGHVVAVETNEDGSIKWVNGQPVAAKNEDGSIKTIVNDKTNTREGEERLGGWYVASRDAEGKVSSYVRFWAWTVGDEAGKIFYMQTMGENIASENLDPRDMPDKMEDPSSYKESDSYKYKWMTEAHGAVVGDSYVNFAPLEPNDGGGRTEGSQTALAINHDTYIDAERGNVLVSKWDDMPDGTNPTPTGGKTEISSYMVETEIGHSSLDIKAGNTTFNGKVGNTCILNNLTIDSSGSIETKDTVQTADKISMTAKKDVVIHNTLSADAKGAEEAIVIRAQERFLNDASDSANALKVGEGSHWKVYSNTPFADTLGDLNSNNFAEWGWDGTSATSTTGDRFIFKYHPTLTFTANNASKKYGETLSDTGYTFNNSLSGRYTQNFYDGDDAKLREHYGLNNVGTQSAGYPASAAVGSYRIDLTNTETTATQHGYNVVLKPGTLTVTSDNPGEVKPQLDPHETTNVTGSASYTEAARNVGPGADRVLGLQSAELPFFREESGQVKLYGTYDVSVDPDKVKMEPTAKVLPEPDQPKNQYREYEKELTTPTGVAKFVMTYNGSTFDIYPADNTAKKMLVAGDVAKNVDVESQALFAAFKEMGITLDDLDGVYTHFDRKN